MGLARKGSLIEIYECAAARKVGRPDWSAHDVRRSGAGTFAV